MRSSKKKATQRFPINSASLSGRVEGLAVLLDCEYTYTNSLSSEGVEVEFVFPLPEGATVCGLSGEIDGRRIEGVIREKAEAKDSYDDAISSGYSAGIVEKVRKNEFRMLLGNLSPNGKATLRISLLTELQLNSEGVACLSVPATMLPQMQKFSFELFIDKRVGEFSLVESPSHKISFSKDASGEKVRIKDEPSHESKDIEILLKPSFTDLPLVSTYPPYSTPHAPTHRYLSSHACMLTFIPKLDTEATQAPAEFIFIMDRSGSMEGSNIKHAKSTLKLLLQSLNIGCYFNIIGFGSDYEMLAKRKSLEYTQESLDSSLKSVDSMRADLGGTYLLPPLKVALNLPSPVPGISRQIMVLTDGETEGVSDIIRLVESSPQRFRVFSFGIGSGASRGLVTGIANAGRGKAVYVQNASEMEQKVLHIMNLAFSPDLRDIEVKFSQPTDFYPTKIPNLFLNERLILYGFINTETQLPVDTQIEAELSFTQEGKKQILVSKFDLSQMSMVETGISMVHLLGSSLALKDWERENEKKEECTLLSCATGIMCKHTAFVLVDSTRTDAVAAPMQKITAPSSKTKRRWNASPCYSPTSPSYSPTSPIYTHTSSYRLQTLNYTCAKKRKRTNTRGGRSRPMSSSRDRDRSRSMSRSMSRSSSSSAEQDGMELSDDDHEDACESKEEREFEYAPLLGNAEVLKSECDIQVRGRASKKECVAKKKKITSTSSNRSYQSLTCVQRAEGSWEYSKKLEQELGVELKSTCPDGISLTLWVTVVCICCLRNNFSSFQTQWLLVVKKGESWAKQQLSELAHRLSYQELTDSAKQIVSQVV